MIEMDFLTSVHEQASYTKALEQVNLRRRGVKRGANRYATSPRVIPGNRCVH